jgi:hypothetical protein
MYVTYNSRFILEGIAEASQIFLRDAHQNYLAMRNTADVTAHRLLIAVYLRCKCC